MCRLRANAKRVEQSLASQSKTHRQSRERTIVWLEGVEVLLHNGTGCIINRAKRVKKIHAAELRHGDHNYSAEFFAIEVGQLCHVEVLLIEILEHSAAVSRGRQASQLARDEEVLGLNHVPLGNHLLVDAGQVAARLTDSEKNCGVSSESR